jgi:hypothetical protein
MYKKVAEEQAKKGQGTPEQEEASQAPDDNVVDAEFTEKSDEKKKSKK